MSFYKILPLIQERYKDCIEIVRYDIIDKSNLEKLLGKTSSTIKKDYKTPKIFIAGNLLEGEEIKRNIDSLIQKELLISSRQEEENVVLSKISKFSLPTIITAGLLDGINPCAFTVIVFFISFLAMAGYKKRQMFYVGSYFIIAVFLAYFLIGLGLFSAFYKLQIYKTLTFLLRYILIIIVFILAVFNLYDYFIYKLKKLPQRLILQLPQRIKFLIQKIISKAYRLKKDEQDRRKGILKLILTSFLVGFVVSILESVCTGQIYFPTATFVAQLPGIIKIKAISYLFIYNSMFILPLIIIFLLGLIGVTSQQFALFLKSHIGKIKLLTAVLFFFLGYILIALY